MRTLPLAGLMLAGCMVSAPAIARPSYEPPMNDFNFTYYTCDNGAAFQVAYDSNEPTEATLTTSNNSKQYHLKRAPVESGAKFSDDKVTFWTDGNSVVVQGTELSFNNCTPKTT